MKKFVWWGTLALVAATLFLRWPSFSRPIWNLDEANTCVEAEHIRAGGVLYRDVVDTRTPLLVYLLAAEAAVIGDWNMVGQHAALAVHVARHDVTTEPPVRPQGPLQVHAVAGGLFP